MPIFIIVALIVAAYIFSPPPIATGRLSVSNEDPWAGCGRPSKPTDEDFRECQEWQAEKRARREAEDRAP